MHTPPLADYVDCLSRGDQRGVGELMLSSAGKLASIGADFLICPDNTIHQAFSYVEPRSPFIAFITEPASVARILKHLELPPTPPPLAPARGPPLDDTDQVCPFDPTAAEPVPDFEFDHTVSW